MEMCEIQSRAITVYVLTDVPREIDQSINQSIQPNCPLFFLENQPLGKANLGSFCLKGCNLGLLLFSILRPECINPTRPINQSINHTLSLQYMHSMPRRLFDDAIKKVLLRVLSARLGVVSTCCVAIIVHYERVLCRAC